MSCKIQFSITALTRPVPGATAYTEGLLKCDSVDFWVDMSPLDLPLGECSMLGLYVSPQPQGVGRLILLSVLRFLIHLGTILPMNSL